MKSQNVARLGTLLSVSLILGLLENMLPPVFPALPYARLGLGNAALLLVLIWFGYPQALLVMTLKCVLIGVFSGAPTMIAYSFAGGILSTTVMFLLLKIGKNGLPAISAVGGIFHNIGQVIVAVLFTGTTAVFALLPYLMLFGAAAGGITGFLCYVVAGRLTKYVLK